MTKVFVYGTLKKGYSNDRLMKNASFEGKGYTIDTFKMLHVGFPVLLPDDDKGRSVCGEVYDVDEKTMASLDNLEANGHMYNREVIPIIMIGTFGTVTEDCWIYIGDRDYWSSDHRTPYTSVNDHGELEWHPNPKT